MRVVAIKGLNKHLRDNPWYRLAIGGGAILALAILVVRAESLVVPFVYLANKGQLTSDEYEIYDTRLVVRSGKSASGQVVLIGQIRGKKIETTRRFLDVKKEDIEAIRTGRVDAIVTTVLFSPSLYEDYKLGPTSYFVLSPEYAGWTYPTAVAYTLAHILPPLVLFGFLLIEEVKRRKAVEKIIQKANQLGRR